MRLLKWYYIWIRLLLINSRITHLFIIIILFWVIEFSHFLSFSNRQLNLSISLPAGILFVLWGAGIANGRGVCFTRCKIWFCEAWNCNWTKKIKIFKYELHLYKCIYVYIVRIEMNFNIIKKFFPPNYNFQLKI